MGTAALSAEPGKPRHTAPGPSLHRWLPTPPARDYSRVWSLPEGYTHWASSVEHNAQAFGRHGKNPWLLGYLRQGQRVPVRLRARGEGCIDGLWYRDPSRGHVCTTLGFKVTTRPTADPGVTLATINRPLPYTYVKVRKGGPRLEFNALPTPAQEARISEALARGEPLPEPAERKVEGAFFVAVDRTMQTAGGAYYRTVRQTFVRRDETEPVPVPHMVGASLGGEVRLPLAFVHLEQGAYLYCSDPAGLVVCGRAQRHARFTVRGWARIGKRSYVRAAEGYMVPRQAVRVASLTPRPSGVGETDQWVHFDLSRQTMTAYQGAKPVYATLISSGKEGYDTETGLFNVYLKWVSDRMSGVDEKDGPYDIDEVPWVMYYKGSFAVHGAYWHNSYGNTRSHGCTNLAPADARWLFYWTEPHMPRGWHGLNTGKGTFFYFTK